MKPRDIHEEHPSDAYKEGVLAYSNDAERHQNPHLPGTVEAAEWEAGFDHAALNDPLADLFVQEHLVEDDGYPD